MKTKSVLCAMLWLLAVFPALAAGQVIELTQVDDSDYPRINLYVSVTDTNGRPVGGLTKPDFAVLEDGREMEILDFRGVGDERPVDVVFVFDTTGSMSEEIDGVKARCVAFAEELESKGRDYRLGLVTFWDEIQGVYKQDGTLTGDVQEFRRWIAGLEASGGDDGPELSLDAMVRASQMRFRDGVQRILILITDASPHHRGDPTHFSDLTIDETLQILESAQITLFAVAPDLSDLPEQDSFWRLLPGRYGLPASNEYERMAKGLGGRFYDIAREPDFTNIIDQIGGLIASQYRLSYETARPTHDGTRRGITVRVGASDSGSGGEARGTYLEKHLLNVRSSPLIGLALFLPLLLALVAPPLSRRIRIASDAKGGHRPRPMQPEVDTVICSRCGTPLRPSAHFCGKCGSSLTPSPSAQTTSCPRCGNKLSLGARFCGRCGMQV